MGGKLSLGRVAFCFLVAAERVEMLSFALAQILSCQSSAVCPTRGQLLEAIIERDFEEFGREAAGLSLLDPDMEIVKTTNNPRISDIACVASKDASESAVDCRYTVKYRTFARYEIATLKPIAAHRWRVESYKSMLRPERK